MQANFTNTACAHLCVRARQAEPPDATSLQARAKQLRRLRELASKLDQSTCLTPELGNSGFPTYLRTACPELLQPTFDGVPWHALHAAAAGCAVVLFTVVFGGYDDLASFFATHPSAVDETPWAAHVVASCSPTHCSRALDHGAPCSCRRYRSPATARAARMLSRRSRGSSSRRLGQ